MLFAVLCLLCALWAFIAFAIDTFSRPLALAGGERPEREGAERWPDLLSLSSPLDETGGPPHASGGERCFAPKRIKPEELVAHTALIRCVVARRLRGTNATSQDVEDIAQGVIVGAWRASEEGRYRPDPSVPQERALRSWLYGLAFNQASNHRELARVRREVLTAEPPDGADSASTVEDALEEHEERARLLAALAQLPEEERAVIVGRDIEGESIGALMARLGAAPATIYRRRVRGIAALVKALRPARG